MPWLYATGVPRLKPHPHLRVPDFPAGDAGRAPSPFTGGSERYAVTLEGRIS